MMQERNDTNNVYQGFVVNIHNSINFDIDIKFPDKIAYRYRKASRQPYSYSLVEENDFLYGTNSENAVINHGFAYRCRLKGISFNSQFRKVNDYEMIASINHLLNLSDRYVTIVVSNIDPYNRILVDIWVNAFNLREMIFSWDRQNHYLPHPSAC